ncbi:transcriptional regulator [Flavipsychrobacter stenotrophus]|uniref:Transcriptional regulator n=1 Tax=Flavipsychrobacter stenotrophus TaxID=2077091 RepID=A0A2S7SZ23_9BACT|nr:helix-turn-helix transcriptional regulator [Flavipsychrobacter stenotrophus]PQJ11948.1 transcriptional regulator [Flavipsychrobacter stenotrophus]
MPPKTAVIAPHIGRKIEKIRTLKGIKQDTLAAKIGMSQGTYSKIEQSATIDEAKLKLIAEALELSVDAIKNFNEDAIVNHIQNNYDSSVVNSQINYQFNSIEKIVELYERMLQDKQELINSLQSQLQQKK